MLFLSATLLCVICSSLVQATSVTPSLPLSFMFDWNDPTQPFPVPVTEQCETINISWGRRTALGPNPSAPYYLQVYTSNFIQPFIIPAGSNLSFNWTVPFAPGTLYQVCMFDKYGYTGGCQDTYTVIESSSGPPTCANVTFAPQLDVAALVDNGPMSQYGFVDQCTDISLNANGTPPYTLTVAPPLHPPYNITSETMPINWTVSLGRAMPFFISLADSNGSLWSNGPMHAGGGGTIGCLAGNVTQSRTVKAPVAIGVSFLTLFVGTALGAAAAFLLLRRRQPHIFMRLTEPKVELSAASAEAPRQTLTVPQLVAKPFTLSDRHENDDVPRQERTGDMKRIPGYLMREPPRMVEDVRPPSYRPSTRRFSTTAQSGLGRSPTTTTLDSVYGDDAATSAPSSEIHNEKAPK